MDDSDDFVKDDGLQNRKKTTPFSASRVTKTNTSARFSTKPKKHQCVFEVCTLQCQHWFCRFPSSSTNNLPLQVCMVGLALWVILKYTTVGRSKTTPIRDIRNISIPPTFEGENIDMISIPAMSLSTHL